MPFLRAAIFLVICLVAIGPLPAQTTVDPHLYDEKVDFFAAKNRRDSFLYYTDLKAQASKAIDSLALWAWVRLKAADYLSEKGDDNASQQYLETIWAEHWRVPKDSVEWEPFCYIQSNRGWYFAQKGKMLPAIVAFEDAAQRYEQFRYADFDVVETVYKPLGNCFTRLGDNDKAIAVLLQALQVGGDNETLAGLYCDLGIAYWNKNDFEAAEKYQRQSLALPGVSKIKQGLLLGALAQTLLDKNQARQAARSAAASLALLAEVKPEGRALEYRCYSRRTAGDAAMRLGQLAAAGTLLSGARADALAAFGKHSRDLGKIEIVWSELYALQGNPEKALDAANRALSAVLPFFQPKKPEQNPDAGGFYEENVIFEALGAKAQAAQLLFEKTGGLQGLKLALDCHDLAWEAENRLRKIYQYSTSKLDLQSNARIREASAMHVARTLFEKTGQQFYLEKAFSIAERSKASLLSESVHENLIRRHLAGSDARFSALSTLRQSFSLFEKQILLDPGNALVGQWRREADDLTSRINILETQINTAYPNLAARRLANFSDVNAGLENGEAFVEYFVGSGKIEAFIFQKNKETTWLSLANSGELQALAGRYLAYFDNQNAILNDPPGYLNTAFSLWQQLLPEALLSADKLTVVPDGFLNFIPFDALVTSNTATASLRDAAYLVRRQEVRYAWSLSVLQQQKNLRTGAKDYALSLAPGFTQGERGLATLTSTATERPTGCKALLNESADLQHFMAGIDKYRVLHLATHAFASEQDGQLPRIELYDQPLFLSSIYALPLQADLVTLSACQTGLGHQQSGEGVMSLARAFAQAGAACVVSSLWSVNDQSTTRLLSCFYRNLESGITIGQALHAAKLNYLNDPGVRTTMQSPYFWAGLTMVGDDRAVKAGPGRSWWIWVLGMLGLSVAVWYGWKRQFHNGQ